MQKMRATCCSLFIAAVFGLGAAIAEPSTSATGQSGAAPPAEGGGAAGKAPGSEGTPAVIVDDDKVESLLGKVVTSSSGDKLGQITDVLIGHAGDIKAAVVDFGGFLGVGTRKVAVAWRALKFAQDAITLDMTRDELRVTPEYREREPIVIVGAASQVAPGNAAQSKTAK